MLDLHHLSEGAAETAIRWAFDEHLCARMRTNDSTAVEGVTLVTGWGRSRKVTDMGDVRARAVTTLEHLGISLLPTSNPGCVEVDMMSAAAALASSSWRATVDSALRDTPAFGASRTEWIVKRRRRFDTMPALRGGGCLALDDAEPSMALDDAEPVAAGDESLCVYELERLVNMERNEAVLRRLGLLPAWPGAPPRTVRARRTARSGPTALMRRSSRLSARPLIRYIYTRPYLKRSASRVLPALRGGGDDSLDRLAHERPSRDRTALEAEPVGVLGTLRCPPWYRTRWLHARMSTAADRMAVSLIWQARHPHPR